ncbi:MAG: hypothetical protein JWQ87_2957 [Candidatus Sulfotelmatobacter sp.]|nr:hypothetical protein [Candidatus Sulfotelmatobacter sp.]
MTAITSAKSLRIVALGWGSLVWDGRNLPVIGGWSADGPELPLEFARESADRRMTLVIVEAQTVIPVLWTFLDVETLDQAVRVLADREGVPKPHVIGRWPNQTAVRYLHEEAIGRWAKRKNLNGVVWTALPPGMRSTRGVTPDLQEVKQHLETLDNTARMKAAEYIMRAPSQIKTAYRSELESLSNIRERKSHAHD